MHFQFSLFVEKSSFAIAFVFVFYCRWNLRIPIKIGSQDSQTLLMLGIDCQERLNSLSFLSQSLSRVKAGLDSVKTGLESWQTAEAFKAIEIVKTS